jgi:hypothetical protein
MMVCVADLGVRVRSAVQTDAGAIGETHAAAWTAAYDHIFEASFLARGLHAHPSHCKLVLSPSGGIPARSDRQWRCGHSSSELITAPGELEALALEAPPPINVAGVVAVINPTTTWVTVVLSVARRVGPRRCRCHRQCCTRGE